MSPALLLATLVQTIWIVDAANGPGANFTDLPPAVAAASNGDTILVRPGNYSAFNASGKTLTMRGSGAATTMVSGSTTTISGVPAGTAFYVGGLSFLAGTSVPDPAYPGLRITGGEVVLADVTASGVSCCILFGTSGLSIEGVGTIVHAVRCSFTGTLGYSAQGGHGVVMSGGLLAADACSFTGGGAGGGFFPFSGAGLYCDSGGATLSGCSAIGGNASLGYGGYGLAAVNAFVRVSGTSLVGGAGSGAPAGYSVFADANSTVVAHGGVSLQGPTTGPVTTGAVPLPYLSLSGTATGAGELQAAQSVTLTLAGQIPNAPFALLVDVVPAFSGGYAPLAIGELLVPVPLVFPLEGTLDGAGAFQLAFTPALAVPAFLDVPLYAQAAVVDAVAGNVRLSNGWIRIFKP